MIQKTISIILFLALIIFCPALSLAAPDISSPDQQAQDLADQIMSPFCPGRTLSACPSPDARKLRDELTVWFGEGKSLEKIKSDLVSQYGAEIIGAPQNSGFGRMAWFMPGLFVVLGLTLIMFVLRRRAASSSAPSSNVVSLANAGATCTQQVDDFWVALAEQEFNRRMEER